MLNRREFLGGVSAGLGLWTLSNFLPQSVLAATTDPESFFVLIYVPNGWDTSLGMAPWTDAQRPLESDYFIEYRQDELLKTSYGLLGPAMASFGKYLEQMRIVNGVFMNATEVGHGSPSLYAQTGNGQGSLSTLSAEMDYNLFKMPMGTVAKGSVFNSGKSLNVMAAQSLKSMTTSPVDNILESPGQSQSELMRAKNTLRQYRDRIDNYIKLMAQFAAQGKQVTEIDALIASFASGLSRTGYISTDTFALDTHAGHPGQHMKTLTEAFTAIKDVFASFEGYSLDGKTSLLSKTTFMIVSEFTRTPALNASQGKDHNPQSNSMILMGPGIKPGISGHTHLVDRKSSLLDIPYLAATPLDKVTEEPVMRRQDAFILRPESVVATVLTSMGMQPSVIGSSVASAPVLKSVLKS